MTGPKTQQRFLGRNAFILDSFLYTDKAVCFMFSFRIYDFCGSELLVSIVFFLALSCIYNCDDGADMVPAFTSHGHLVQ